MVLNSKPPQLPARASAQEIRHMFAETASRYDLLNHLLSLNLDRLWRRRTVRESELGSTPKRVLDICCGTGDLTLAYATSVVSGSTVTGLDFCPEMVALAPPKVPRSGAKVPVGFMTGDALSLPFSDGSFDVVSVAFGIRNVESPLAGLREMFRVLSPGGRAIVLECAMPTLPLVSPLYRWYFRSVLPRVGRLISRAKVDAYSYLPASVEVFPGPEAFAALMAEAGFENLRRHSLSFGTVQLHVGFRPSATESRDA